MKKLKWDVLKDEKGFLAKADQGWYFIARNATYWCSHDPFGNNQISDGWFPTRLKIAKEEAQYHYTNEHKRKTNQA